MFPPNLETQIWSFQLKIKGNITFDVNTSIKNSFGSY